MELRRIGGVALASALSLAVASGGRAQGVYSNVVINTRNFTGGAGGAIPDDNIAGITTSINVATAETVIAVNSITINGLTHTWGGDLTATIGHSGTNVTLFANPNGGDSTNFGGNYTFVNGGANLNAAFGALGDLGVVASGNYAPQGNFDAFAGQSSSGAWNLNISDDAAQDTGSFTGWNLSLLTGNITTIPDAPTVGSPTASVSSLVIADNFTIGALNSVTIRGLNHTAVGDLIVSLVHVPSNTTVDLFSTVGKTTTDPFDIGDDSNLDGDYVFALGGASFADAAAVGNSAYAIPSNVTYAASTSVIPGQARATTLASFNGLNANGEWQLRVTDTATGDVGSYYGFILDIAGVAVPEPGTPMLLLWGGAALAFAARRRKKSTWKGN